MDYSNVFVCLMGIGTVFFGLICLIALTTVMGHICRPHGDSVSIPDHLPSTEPNRQELVAAVSAAIAEDLGTDITGIRILSIKKL